MSDDEKIPDELAAAAYEVCTASAREGGPELAYHYSQLIRRLNLTVDQRLTILIAMLKSEELEWPDNVALIEETAKEFPVETCAALVQELRVRARWQLWITSAHVLSAARRGAGADTLLSAMRDTSSEERARLLDHFNFAASELDPVVISLLEDTDSDEFRRAMNSRFVWPGEAVMGSYADHLSQRQALLVSWAASHPSPAVRAWAEQLVPAMDPMIQQERLRESEERW